MFESVIWVYFSVIYIHSLCYKFILCENNCLPDMISVYFCNMNH